ncbi:MAG TPA: GDYXXLXY domain-containing protein [Beijerinckiaceae bacterium]|jgi:uncharacterized membrane-anchored protein
MRTLLAGAAFAALFLAQAAPAMKMAVDHTQTLTKGKPVLLAVETRDPRDLFRGEYSILTYEIGRPRNLPASPAGLGGTCDLTRRPTCYLPAGKEVYVRLEPDAGGIHRGVEVLFERPGDGVTFIAGTVRSGSLSSVGAGNGAAKCDKEACFQGDIVYGIENWFGPQGVPAKVDGIDRRDIVVRARLDAAGRPALDALVVKGEDFGRTARLW